jgi:hypothetical protein
MSIRMIAKELYRLEQEVKDLEARIQSAPFHEREGMKDRLRRVKAERDRMRKILDGKKVTPPFRQPL